ncbi:FBP domain-containing protein [Curtobacterium sp. MCSS17_015]|uniref:FBP domain-containing protein n=1 Tax=Curtobacterium sp. MCSS17_015 TaxID=2175666 RepID=UPI000DA8438A|nr:FBP domain-containing protein [Curtobacterium sp. MCSS17_015]WIB26428.1 FBP domain-containing protein [Curtobacterium sp. MCSS17_015]
MLPLTIEALRASFVNASRRELADMTVPDLDAVAWDDLTYFGWRDPKTARRAAAVIPTLEGGLVGILFRQAEASPRSRAQCSWCQDVKLPNDVVFYAAKRSGSSGRKGNTVGTLVCQDFQCSRNVRRTPPPAYEGYDVEAARLRRMEDLQVRVATFAAEV